jgi:copper(I)-binding protein
MRLLALSLLLCFSVPGFAQFPQDKHSIQIENPWSRATAPGTKLAAGYMTLRNAGNTPDRLLGASSPLAAKVETHVTIKDGDIMRMRQVPFYELPARGHVELKPGGAHLMLVDIKQPFKEGDKVPVTLRFEKAGEVKVELLVTKSPPQPAEHNKH